VQVRQRFHAVQGMESRGALQVRKAFYDAAMREKSGVVVQVISGQFLMHQLESIQQIHFSVSPLEVGVFHSEGAGAAAYEEGFYLVGIERRVVFLFYSPL
jgi:hypothetical protein